MSPRHDFFAFSSFFFVVFTFLNFKRIMSKSNLGIEIEFDVYKIEFDLYKIEFVI